MKTTDKYYTLKITQDKKQLSLFLAYFHESTDMQQKKQQIIAGKLNFNSLSLQNKTIEKQFSVYQIAFII